MIILNGQCYNFSEFGGKYSHETFYISEHGAFDSFGYTYLLTGSVDPLDVFKYGDEGSTISEEIKLMTLGRVNDKQILVLLRPGDKYDENEGKWLNKYVTIYQEFVLSEGYCDAFDYPKKMLNDARKSLHEYFDYQKLVDSQQHE